MANFAPVLVLMLARTSPGVPYWKYSLAFWQASVSTTRESNVADPRFGKGDGLRVKEDQSSVKDLAKQ